MKIAIELVTMALLMCRVCLGATVNLAWDAPVGETNAITFTVWTSSPGAAVQARDVGTNTAAAMGGLVNGSAYSFYVTAVWQGVHSVPSSTLTYTVPLDLPPAPVSWFQSIALQGDGNYKATLNWNAAAAGYAITNYLMIAKLDGTRWMTNSVGTNVTGTLLVPSFGTISLYLQGQSALATSALGHQVTYSRPGQSKNLRIVSVSAQ